MSYPPAAARANRLSDRGEPSLYTAINDFVEPRLKRLEDDMEKTLRKQVATRSRDDEKRFETLQSGELERMELRDTLFKIAQGYRPDQGDGVQITAAPLWSLFRHKPWQKILKDTWARLERGDYDWAHLAIDEGAKGPEVVEKWLQWRRGTSGKPFSFLEFRRGIGRAARGDAPDLDEVRVETRLRSPDLIAVNTLGQFSEHQRVAALREFIADGYVSYLAINQTRNQPAAGAQERLSKGGENLPNVIQ